MRRERVYNPSISGDLLSSSMLEAFQKRGFVMSTSSPAKTVTAHRGVKNPLKLNSLAVIMLARKNARHIDKQNK